MYKKKSNSFINYNIFRYKIVLRFFIINSLSVVSDRNARLACIEYFKVVLYFMYKYFTPKSDCNHLGYAHGGELDRVLGFRVERSEKSAFYSVYELVLYSASKLVCASAKWTATCSAYETMASRMNEQY